MNSHRGLYQYKRIPYGIESAPPIFQRCIESIVAGIPNVLVFLVDILITGKTLIEHQQNLYEALGRLEKADLKLGVNKCQFYMNLVAYLGNNLYLARVLNHCQRSFRLSLKCPDQLTLLKCRLT